MPHRYTSLPSSHPEADDTELDAAFDDLDGEPDDSEQDQVTRPLISRASSSLSAVPGTYDFEAVDYDFPPPGSPPAPSSSAIPDNDFGNSNGTIPVLSPDNTPQPPRSLMSGWFRRTAANVLPSHYVSRWGVIPRAPHGAIGGGTNNDGVFANVTAKPTTGVRVQDGDNVYMVPEESVRESPPSYAAAQADAAPPYFSNTIFAPFNAGSMSVGSVVVDNLPTGTLFTFMWNALISVSFQFIGFLLTYLMHTTHAGKFGSRAGLGVTMIQFGFGLRAQMEDALAGEPRPTQWPSAAETMTFGTGTETEDYYQSLVNNSTMMMPNGVTTTDVMVVSATTDWLSFFLMTVGWFLLLTSALGFWRVKRWEASMLASSSGIPSSVQAQEERRPFWLSFTNAFRSRREVPGGVDDLEEEMQHMMTNQEAEADPERANRLRTALEHERRLHSDLRAAGLL